jgi:hypothetical protein
MFPGWASQMPLSWKEIMEKNPIPGNAKISHPKMTFASLRSSSSGSRAKPSLLGGSEHQGTPLVSQKVDTCDLAYRRRKRVAEKINRDSGFLLLKSRRMQQSAFRSKALFI